jgi:hypothetical protein
VNGGGWLWVRFEHPPHVFVHVIPVCDLRPHEIQDPCWCHPERDEDNNFVVNHNSLDGREAFERGERQVS